ncbi:MAG: hypothetical protein D6766_05330 [Verrucomicrobia bacterium]|nr:MAG: hypothetical protein D6766_05330 [Verrucomicrobiota bacterium]
MALALLAVFLTAVWGAPRRWLGAPLGFLPAVLVGAALDMRTEGWRWVAVAGGLAADTFSLNPLGASILPLYVTGAFLRTRHDLWLGELPFAQAVLGAGAAWAVALLTLPLVMTFGEPPVLGLPLAWRIGVFGLSAAALTPVVFALNRRLDRWLAHPELDLSSFRTDREIVRTRR